MGAAVSGRRGVHHSGGLRAKRRWLAWRRYQRRCERVSGTTFVIAQHAWRHKMLPGYVGAHTAWSYVGRYPPIGIRDVRP